MLTMDATGVVTRAVVEKPVGHGFDEAAVEAAQKLQFEPATRDGKPVAARIALRLSLHASRGAVLAGRVVTHAGERPIAGRHRSSCAMQPGQERTATTGADGVVAHRRVCRPAPTTSKVSGPGQGPARGRRDRAGGRGGQRGRPPLARGACRDDRAAPAAKPQEEQVEEVEVHGEKPPREVTKRTLEQRELSRIPGTNGDALRSLQNLPGVARPPAVPRACSSCAARRRRTRSTSSTARRCPSSTTSAACPRSCRPRWSNKLDFYPGNFSAQYGRAMGGIVDVGLADPKERPAARDGAGGPHRRARAGAGAARATRVAVRRSARAARTIDTWLAPGAGGHRRGRERHARLLRLPGGPASATSASSSSIRFAFFGSDDKLDVFLPTASSSEPDLAGTLGTHTGFWRAQGLYKNSAERRHRAARGRRRRRGLRRAQRRQHLLQPHVSGRSARASSSLEQAVEATSRSNMGIDMMLQPYTLSAQLPPLPKAGPAAAGPLLGAAAAEHDT